MVNLLLTQRVCAAAAEAAEPMRPLDLRQVTVGGVIGQRVEATIRNNICRLNIDDDFLRPFREKTSRSGGYIGLGKLIDALVRLAANSRDAQVLTLKKEVVGKTIAAQEPDGYLGVFAAPNRMWQLWDISEAAYLIYGLASDHRYFQEKGSLEAARKLADYIVGRWSAEPQRQPGEPRISTHMAVTGLERALLLLFEETGDRRHLDFCVHHRRLHEWDLGIVLGRWGRIEGHAYAYLAHCSAQLQLGRLEPFRLSGSEPHPKLLVPTRRAIEFLTRGDGMVISGACGMHECWHDTQEATFNLGETCATAYLLRLLDDLIRLDGDSRWGDLMERSIYNALFAAQSPDGRRIRYYTPLEGKRDYWPRDTYCCPCNYRRIVADLPLLVYYRVGTGVAVNLYTPSQAEVELADGVPVVIRQETDYPSSGRVRIFVDPVRPAKFPVKLRIPRWCSRAKAAVNGQTAGGDAPGGKFLSLTRTWKARDYIDLEMPMEFRLVKGRKAQAGRVAVMRGPVVFCLNRARHPQVAETDLRSLVLTRTSVEGPLADETVRPHGVACRVKASAIGLYKYAQAEGPEDLTLTLTELPDPDGELAYFRVANPAAPALTDDELVEQEP
jgi:DUF1680 family protein